MTQAQLPVIGAAMCISELPQFMGWLVEGKRDLELQDPSYASFLDRDNWRKDTEAARKQIDNAGYQGRLGIHAAFDGLDLATEDKLIRQVIQTRYLESLEYAEILGGTHMVIHSPFLTFGSASANFSPAPNRRRVIDAVHAILEPILPVAERLGCMLVIETIFDKSPFPLIDLVRSFDSPLVRLSIDTGHASIMERNGGTPPHQWVVEAGELLGHIHLQDVDGHADRHWAIGDGDIRWNALFRALGKLSHQPRLVLELADVNDIPQSMQWLEAHQLAC